MEAPHNIEFLRVEEAFYRKFRNSRQTTLIVLTGDGMALPEITSMAYLLDICRRCRRPGQGPQSI